MHRLRCTCPTDPTSEDYPCEWCIWNEEQGQLKVCKECGACSQCGRGVWYHESNCSVYRTKRVTEAVLGGKLTMKQAVQFVKNQHQDRKEHNKMAEARYPDEHVERIENASAEEVGKFVAEALKKGAEDIKVWGSTAASNEQPLPSNFPTFDLFQTLERRVQSAERQIELLWNAYGKEVDD